MFQIIVAVIAIALAAALAAASIFYGGSAFMSSTAKAQTTTMVNGAQQIAGAQALYRTDNAGAWATDINVDLVQGDYLQAVPTPPQIATGSWALSSDGMVSYIQINDANAGEICPEVANQNGGTASHVVGSAWGTVGDEIEVPATAQFVCVTDDADPAEATGTYFAYKN